MRYTLYVLPCLLLLVFPVHSIYLIITFYLSLSLNHTVLFLCHSSPFESLHLFQQSILHPLNSACHFSCAFLYSSPSIRSSVFAAFRRCRIGSLNHRAFLALLYSSLSVLYFLNVSVLFDVGYLCISTCLCILLTVCSSLFVLPLLIIVNLLLFIFWFHIWSFFT